MHGAHVQASQPRSVNDTIGSYDDVLAVQVAKARFALLSLEAATKSVQAPTALPMDVQEINLGPDATLRSATPEKIRRVSLDLPQGVFAQQAVLDQEIRNGARYPETRTGNSDASVITGRGVQALGAGFDSQIKAAQTVIAHGLGALFSKAMKMDETLWPNDEKTIRGNSNGTPYELKYTPTKDIKGDHTINVQYGLMAGLQANQALVFGLQARGDKLISRSFLRTQLPISFDPAEEEAKVDVEDLRDSMKEAFAAMAQAIPAMAQQGQAPTGDPHPDGGCDQSPTEGCPHRGCHRGRLRAGGASRRRRALLMWRKRWAWGCRLRAMPPEQGMPQAMPHSSSSSRI